MLEKYVKVMFGNKSSANGFEYKIEEVNIAENWKPNEKQPKDKGGFYVSTEDKILRYLVRGDTIMMLLFQKIVKLLKWKVKLRHMEYFLPIK